MPFNASGIFERLFSWVTERDEGRVQIRAEDMDAEFDELVGGVNDIVSGEQPFLAPVKTNDGTFALPAFSFTDAPDTGFFRLVNGNIGVTVGGAQVGELSPEFLQSVSALAELSDADLTNLQADQMLVYDGTSWVNVPASESGASELVDLDDIGDATPADGNLLFGDGTQFTSRAIAPADIPALPYISDLTTHSINEFSDVGIDAPEANDVLQWDGSQFVNAPPDAGGSGSSAGPIEHVNTSLTTDQSEVAIDGLSQYKRVLIDFAWTRSQNSPAGGESNLAIQARTAGGTWRTIGSNLITDRRNYVHLEINNLDTTASKIIQYRKAISDGVLDNSDAINYFGEPDGEHFWLSAYSETWDEVRFTLSNDTFEGSEADQRGRLVVYGFKSGLTPNDWHSGAGVPSNTLGVDNDLYFQEDSGEVLKKANGQWALTANLSGADGADGKTIHEVSGAPTNGLGVDGDYAIDPTAMVFYGPKTAGAWPAGISMMGADGIDGNTTHSVTDTPAAGLGVDGDFAINYSTHQIYGPKTGGSWGLPTSLIGPTGAAGKTIHEVSGDPAAGVGVDGDYAFDPATASFYGPKASGAWPAAIDLVGPEGPPGSADPANSELWQKPQRGNVEVVTFGANVAFDFGTQPRKTLTLTGNTTFDAPTNSQAGSQIVIETTQDGTGGRTITWNAAFTFDGGVPPEIETSANTRNVFYIDILSDGAPYVTHGNPA